MDTFAGFECGWDSTPYSDPSGRGGKAGLILAAKARAMLAGQLYVSCDDVAAVAPPIFRYRIILNFAAQSESVTADDITRKILETVPKDEQLR